MRIPLKQSVALVATTTLLVTGIAGMVTAAGPGWQTAQEVSGSIVTAAPETTTSGNGQVLVIADYTVPASLLTRHATADGSWGPLVEVGDSSKANTAATISHDGKVLAFVEDDTTVKVLRYSAGAWHDSGHDFLAALSGFTAVVAPVLSGDGNSLALRYRNGSSSSIVAVSKFNGSSWGTPVPLDPEGSNEHSELGLRGLSYDGSYAGTTFSDASGNEAHAFHFNGTNWAKQFTSPGTTTGVTVAPVLDREGTTIVYSQRSTSANAYRIFSSNRTGTSWSTPWQISAEPGSVNEMATWPTLAADGSKVAWQQGQNANLAMKVFSSHKLANGQWAVAALVSPDTQVAGQPSMSGDGTLLTYQLRAAGGGSRSAVVTTPAGDAWSSSVTTLSPVVDGNLVDGLKLSANGSTAVWVDVEGSGDQPAWAIRNLSAPSAPRDVTAISPSAGKATVTWSEPLSDGGSEVTKYTVQAFLDGKAVSGKTCTVSAPMPTPLSCSITGLTSGKTYVFAVTATNAVGAGAAGEVSLKVGGAWKLTIAQKGAVKGKVPNRKAKLKGTTKGAKQTVYIYRSATRKGAAQLVKTTKSKQHLYSTGFVSLGGRQAAFFCARVGSKWSNTLRVPKQGSAKVLASTGSVRGDVVRCR